LVCCNKKYLATLLPTQLLNPACVHAQSRGWRGRAAEALDMNMFGAPLSVTRFGEFLPFGEKLILITTRYEYLLGTVFKLLIWSKNIKQVTKFGDIFVTFLSFFKTISGHAGSSGKALLPR
jgi:hypothetical protein